MGQVDGQAWVGGDGSMAVGLVQIGDGLWGRKNGLWVCGGRKKRWRGSEERHGERRMKARKN